jgi:hypothetical protein
MILKPRPKTLLSHKIDVLEASLARQLLHALGKDFRTVHIVEEMYGRTSIYVHCEISIEHYVADAQRINLSIAKHTTDYFKQHPVLECLVTRVDIWDDKVAVSDEWFQRNDIIAWAQGEIDDESLLERGTSYW